MINNRLLTRLGDKKALLDARRPLPAAAVSRIEEQLAIEWTYNSNAIEGNTLTLRETQLILEHGITIGGKSLREHFEVVNHRDAIAWVELVAKQDEPVSPSVVRQLHALVMARIDDENTGQYRQLPVRIAGSSHEPPPAWEVPARVADWAAWLAGQEGAGEPVELAALAHHRLVAIHPFLDGNGRTARLVLNLLLLRAGYPPAIIARVNRAQYYRVLAAADRGNDGPLANFVGRAAERSLTLYLEGTSSQYTPPLPDDEWLLLSHAADGTPYSPEYLGFLARTGRLEAVKRGRNWQTTRRAIDAYIASLD